jgi:hypothetical protein
VFQEASKTAPGSDGICLEFFKAHWESIQDDMLDLINLMYMGGRIMEQQKQVIVVCISNTSAPTAPVDYRPITLLKTDYKILAKIITNRLRPTFSELLHPNQYRGVRGTTIFVAVATMRDSIAYAELTHAPLCILSLDSSAAIDRISHTNIFRGLKHYGFSTQFTHS